MAAMMLAANRIAANVMVVRPELASGALSKILSALWKSGSVAGAYEAEDTRQMLNCVEQVPRRLATRLANSRETTTHEEQRA